jgi:pimeloyl-ACP methyl ester carboxylesterase
MFIRVLSLLLSSASLFAGQEQIAKANGIDIWYETFGEKENPALLLIMGGCCQGVIWHRDLCNSLADEGFYVIRYDHRDSGLSTCFDYEKDPYDLMDMTKDAVGVLDAAGIIKAHLFGVSMGGLISELLAAYYPEKVHTITLLGSTCDIRPMNLALAGQAPEENALYSPPRPHYLAWMKEFMKLSPETHEEKLAQRMEGWNRLNGQIYPLDEKINREMQTEFLLRLRYPQGMINHIAMLNTQSSEEHVRTAPAEIRVPAVILQGSEDPIFPPDHGEALSRAIVGSEYIPVEGMGHIPNEHFYDLYIDVLKRQASKIPKRPQEPTRPLLIDKINFGI